MPTINENFLKLEKNYLFINIAKKVNAFMAENPDAPLIRMGIGDVTLPIAPVCVEAMKKGADEMGVKETFRGYEDSGSGYDFLKEAIAGYYKKFGVSLELDEIRVNDGAKSDCGNIVDIFGDDNIVLITDPAYPVYVDSNKMNGRTVIYADSDESNGFAAMPDSSVHADLIYLCSPNNPTGSAYTREQLIMSIIYKAKPEDVKLIMIDPKVVELSAYNGIPHLLIPVVTDPKKAAGALNWAVAEMMGRYNQFAELNVRNIEGYNEKIDSIKDIPDDNKREKMPQIVIIVDELADLMMVAPGEVEEAICRLAQLARAAGIHLIIATQRPSVDVITGLIKANMPSRVAFAVSSGVDSRTILDMNGAEKLLGKGDMLFYPQGYSKPVRVQGAFVSDNEVSDVVDFLKNQNIGNVYDASNEIEEKMKSIGTSSGGAASGSSGPEYDAYFADAGRFIIEKDKASIGMLQRVFKIGFNRAARLMDQLAEVGVVGEEEGTKPRKVLMTETEFEQLVEEIL